MVNFTGELWEYLSAVEDITLSASGESDVAAWRWGAGLLRVEAVLPLHNYQICRSNSLSLRQNPRALLSGDGPMLTCFDHNFLKSTNFSASRPSWNAEWRDLALGAKSNFQNANFHAEISRNFSWWPTAPRLLRRAKALQRFENVWEFGSALDSYERKTN